MAVVQISKIQLRRGRRTDLPVLASGEMAWCVDSQELFVGSGAVAEGAPAVGNVKLLTEADSISLLDVMEYTYKAGDSVIQTGADVNFPTVRTLQDRLDDYVNSADYGLVSGSDDQTEILQRIINNLFLENSYAGVSSRVVLTLQPGEYTFSETIYIPSYVRIEGAGKDRTVLTFTGTGPAFAFVNGTSDVGDPKGIQGVDISSTTYNNQPQYCYLGGFTVQLEDATAVGFELNAVRDSVFRDISILGAYTGNPSDTGIGIGFYAYSSVVTCQRNTFDNVDIKTHNTVVWAMQDILNNKFTNSYFENAKYGFRFGVGADGLGIGEAYGPRKNIIEKCFFNEIKQEGIYVELGHGNKSINNTFVDVGNNGAGNTGVGKGLYSQIRFATDGNTSTDDNFDRADPYTTSDDLALNNFSTSYVKEVSGRGQFDTNETISYTLERHTSFTSLARFPYVGSSGFEIKYLIKSNSTDQIRKGTLTVSVNADTQDVQLSDEYEYTGSTLDGEIKISFNAVAYALGGSYTGAGTLWLQYKNENIVGETFTITYTHRSIS